MYVTTYTRAIKRREKKTVETTHAYYSTKSLTPMHRRIRMAYPGAKTYENVERVITHLIGSMPLDRPIVCGGKVIVD